MVIVISIYQRDKGNTCYRLSFRCNNDKVYIVLLVYGKDYILNCEISIDGDKVAALLLWRISSVG